MRVTHKITKLLLPTLVIMYGINTAQVRAGLIKVSNTAKSKIIMRVIPGCFDENTTYCWSCFVGCVGPDRCRTKHLLIPAERIGSDTLTLVGTEGGLLFNGICSGLSTQKNYEIIFFDTSLGIGCRSTEI